MTPNVVGVRQNLKLIVDHGKVPASVNQNVLGLGRHPGRRVLRLAIRDWHHQGRPGHLRLRPGARRPGLADLLKRAGAVEGLQLDINPELDVLRVLPGEAAIHRTRPRNPCCPPSRRALPVLLACTAATSRRSTHGDRRDERHPGAPPGPGMPAARAGRWRCCGPPGPASGRRTCWSSPRRWPARRSAGGTAWLTPWWPRPPSLRLGRGVLHQRRGRCRARPQPPA